MMRLATARLCLDCDEVHEDEQCPVCGSKTFAFLTRWVIPATKPRAEAASRTARSVQDEDRAEQIDAYRQLLGSEHQRPHRGRFVAHGALGLAVLGLARLAWRTRRILRNDAGIPPKAGSRASANAPDSVDRNE